MRILVTYDVNTESSAGRRRLRLVAKACEGFGQRVQKSVFECDLGETDFVRLRHDLVGIIDETEDDLRIYRLSETVRMEHYGKNISTDFRGPLVV